MKKMINGVIVQMSAEEIAQREDDSQRAAAEDAHRSLTQDEVTDLLIRAQVNTVEIDDQVSLRMMDYYPNFTDLIGVELKKGFKLRHGGKLYKTAQVVIPSDIYPPGMAGTESLYTRIDTQHLGNKYDPIPYEGNMELAAGLYYVQGGVMYLCTRDTGAPVHHALAELVGTYVEVIA